MCELAAVLLNTFTLIQPTKVFDEVACVDSLACGVDLSVMVLLASMFLKVGSLVT